MNLRRGEWPGGVNYPETTELEWRKRQEARERGYGGSPEYIYKTNFSRVVGRKSVPEEDEYRFVMVLDEKNRPIKLYLEKSDPVRTDQKTPEIPERFFTSSEGRVNTEVKANWKQIKTVIIPEGTDTLQITQACQNMLNSGLEYTSLNLTGLPEMLQLASGSLYANNGLVPVARKKLR